MVAVLLAPLFLVAGEARGKETVALLEQERAVFGMKGKVSS